MTSRSILATQNAVAMSRIEALLPQEFLESLPKAKTERETKILEFMAGMMERRASTKKAQNQQVEAGVQKQPKATTENDLDVDADTDNVVAADKKIVGTPTDVAEAKAAAKKADADVDAATKNAPLEPAKPAASTRN